jgi:diguanylate cyclase (GGDEF)-like protein/PAS domain S-box-containing protein
MAQRRGTTAAVALTLILAVAAAVATAVTIRHSEHHRAAQERRDEAHRAAADLRSRFDLTVAGLSTIQDFFASSQEVTGTEFDSFVSGLAVEAPLTSTLLVTRVPASLRRSFERSPGSQPIRQGLGAHPRRAPARAEYYPISYRFSRSDRRLRVGLDLAADPVRSRALAAARDSGRPRATPPVTLPETGHRGLLLFLPIYIKGAPVATVAERRMAIKSLAANAIDIRALGRAVTSLRREGTVLQLSDGATRIYGPAHMHEGAVTTHVDAAGRRWTLRVYTPVHTTTALPVTVLVGGLALIALVALLLLGFSRRERYAQRLSDRRLAEREEAEGARRAAEQRFQRAFEDSSVGMALLGGDDGETDRMMDVNDALCTMVGRTREELLGRPLSGLLEPAPAGEEPDATPEDAPLHVERLLATTGDDEDPRWMLVSTSVVSDHDHDEGHRLAQIQDVSERKRFEARLRHQADHDSVTGLFNRRRFEQELAREVSAATRYHRRGAVLTLDLDHFKYTNDSLGHSVGDELITRAGAVLAERLRESDTVARLGGDEFAAILPEADEEEALRVAEYLLRSIREEAVVTGKHGRTGTTASVGITLFSGSEPGVSAGDLLAEADIAMYDAKESGRDRCVLFAVDGREARMATRLNWVERIRSALAEDRFVLHGQAILGLGDDQRPRQELLLRMVEEDGTLIAPGDFLHVAERFDLIQAIDRWVIRRAVELLARLDRNGTKTVLEVNVSAKSLTDGDLPGAIAGWLEETGADPAGLVFEMTETAAIVNVEHAKSFAASVHELGCEFAIDDFGAGFASFYYLKHLAFDYLKIDGEFIADLPRNETNRLLVRALVGIARGLGKRTVAEFVGDAATLELLRELGVDYAQGFHVAMPQPIDAEAEASPALS